MKDIDFDELDKAVNSLMGGVKVSPEQPAAKTLNINTTLKDGELPAYSNIKQAAEKIGNETIISPTETTEILPDPNSEMIQTIELPDFGAKQEETPASAQAVVVETTPVPAPKAVDAPVETVIQKTDTVPVPAAVTPKASGRFMDVMHPSSDMKTANTTETHARDAATVAVPPRETPSPIASAEEIPVPFTPPVAEPTVVDPPVPETAVTIAPAAPPVEVIAEPEVVAPPTPVQSVVAPEKPVATEALAPLTTPFLPDAKVEKRPLGGSEDSSNDLDHKYDSHNASDAQIPLGDVPAPDLPAELHTDLLAIETNLASTDEDAREEPAPSSDTSHAALVGSPEVPAPSVDTASQTADPEDGAIFDTTEYHTAVQHPAKHGKEWMWILAIILIVIVCAAGGAAFYLLSTK